MDNPEVERYLAAIDVRLRALPPTRRDEELRELRQHLAALVDGHRARGLSEDEAVAMALRQFGRAEQIGQDLHEAWARPGQPQLWPWVFAYLGFVALIFGAFATANDQPTDFPYHLGDQLLLALALPAGTLALQVAAYLRGRQRARGA